MRCGHSLILVALLGWLGCEHVEPARAEFAPAPHAADRSAVATDPPVVEAPRPARNPTRPPRKLNYKKARTTLDHAASSDTDRERDDTMESRPLTRR